MSDRDRQVDPVAGCAGKVRFTSWAEADRVARKRGKAASPKPGAAYACRFCGGFHIGKRNLG